MGFGSNRSAPSTSRWPIQLHKHRAGVNAYVIDTGILPTHQDFGGRASVAYDAVGDGRNGIDCNGHGTHVSGTLGGTTYGVAKSVHIYAVRVLNCSGSGADSTVIAGVDWVTGHGIHPAVANMSLGGPTNSFVRLGSSKLHRQRYYLCSCRREQQRSERK